MILCLIPLFFSQYKSSLISNTNLIRAQYCKLHLIFEMGQSNGQISNKNTASEAALSHLEKRFTICSHPYYAQNADFKLLHQKLTHNKFVLRIMTNIKADRDQIDQLICKKMANPSIFVTKLQQYIFQNIDNVCGESIKCYLLIQLQSGNTLNSLILKRSIEQYKFSQSQILEGLNHLTFGLLWLRFIGHPHGNINPQNIYLNNGKMVLSDPWIAPQSPDGAQMYSSPERLLKVNNKLESYDSYVSDVYSIAMSILQMANGANLYKVYRKNYTINQQILTEEISKCPYPKLKIKLQELLLGQPAFRKKYLDEMSTKIKFSNFDQSKTETANKFSKSGSRIGGIRRVNTRNGQLKNQRKIYQQPDQAIGFQKPIIQIIEDKSLFQNKTVKNQTKSHPLLFQINSANHQNLNLEPLNHYKSVNSIINQNNLKEHNGKPIVNIKWGVAEKKIEKSAETVFVSNALSNYHYKPEVPLTVNYAVSPINIPNFQNKISNQSQNFQFNQQTKKYELQKNQINWSSLPTYQSSKPNQVFSNFHKTQTNFKEYDISKLLTNDFVSLKQQQQQNKSMVTPPPINKMTSAKVGSIEGESSGMSECKHKISQNMKQFEDKISDAINSSIQNLQPKPITSFYLNQYSSNNSKVNDHSIFDQFTSIRPSNQTFNDENKKKKDYLKQVTEIDAQSNLIESIMKEEQQSVIKSKNQERIQLLVNQNKSPKNYEKVQVSINANAEQFNNQFRAAYRIKNNIKMVSDSHEQVNTSYYIKANEEQSSEVKSDILETPIRHNGYGTTLETLNNLTIPQSSEQESIDQNQKQSKGQYLQEIYENGGRYEGFIYNGKRNGEGTFYYRDGGYYTGHWKDNMMNGYGKLYYDSGELAYEGQWYKDEFHGRGIVYNDSYEEVSDSFNYKTFQSIELYWKFYDGDLSHDTKEGYGKIMLSNGEYYIGQFKNDIAHGKGHFYRADGQVIHGIWAEGTLTKQI